MASKSAHVVRVVALVALASASGIAKAMMPAQTAAAQATANTQKQDSNRALAEQKRRVALTTLRDTENAQRAKAVLSSRRQVHEETKRRVEAARKAFELHARVRAAQNTATANAGVRDAATKNGPSRRPVTRVVKPKTAVSAALAKR